MTSNKKDVCAECGHAWSDHADDGVQMLCPDERQFSAAEVIEIANETSDSSGNLYRLDFIDRIRHEATTTRGWEG